jgi:hypothetical protein
VLFSAIYIRQNVDVHESVHRDTTVKITNKMHLLFFFFFFQALNILGESFGLLNDLFPFPLILEAGYPNFDLHLADVLFDVILPSVLGSSL